MPEHPNSIVADAAAYLASEERDIFFRWTQRASRLHAAHGQSDMPLAEVRDGVPAIFRQLRAVILSLPHAQQLPDTAIDSAEHHAVERFHQGVPVRDVVEEYRFLRREIWYKIRQWHKERPLAADDILLLEEVINFTLDEFIALTLEKFVKCERELQHGKTGETSNDPGS